MEAEFSGTESPEPSRIRKKPDGATCRRWLPTAVLLPAFPEDTQCGYPEEMKAYAQTVNVPVIDLHQKTGAWLTQIGETESAKYYMTHAGDNTHLTYNGVVELNRMAKEEMVKLGLPINTYFK